MKKILKGMGVSQGKVTGKVRLISSVDDSHEFEEGDILVTRLTDPTMVVLMGKAAGIICDIGGLTSHPSIVSREMGIPCIVSASCIKSDRKATEILKDGMRISMCGQIGDVHLVDKNSKNEISKFIDSMSIAVGNMDLETLEPMSFSMFHPLFAKEWVDKIEKVMKIIEEKGISIEEVAELISGPSSLRAQFYFLLIDLKCSKSEKEKRVKIASFINEILKKRAVDDVYGRRSNIVHTKEDVKLMLDRIKWNKGDSEISKLLGRLYSSAYHVINGLYTDFYTDFGVENFGEYDLGEGQMLIIRKFNDLNPKELWNEVANPCKELVIYTIYKNVKFKCDAISVHTIYEGDNINNLVLWAVEIDGRFIDSVHELKVLKSKLEVKSVEQWQRLIGLSFEELKLKGLFMRGYVFKDLFERVGLDWKPSGEMINTVKNKEFIGKEYWGVSENQDDYWRKILDPWIDFYPKDA